LATRSLTNVGGDESAFRLAMSTSRSGAIAWEQSDPTEASVIRVRPTLNRAAYVLVDHNPQARDWVLGEQEVIRWKNRHGDELEGVLIKPVGYDKSRRYPVIVDAYPEPNNFKGWTTGGNQAWASRGYAVFWPNARAPHTWMNPVKSQTYNQAAKGPKGWEVTIDDVMSGVDELIKIGLADPDRLCLYGFSNGGGIVNYVVTLTNRFKCAVSVAPALSDWVRPSILEARGWVLNYADGVSPWEHPAETVELSAVFHTSRVTTPMLLAAGDEDDDPLLDSIEMYNGLRKFGDEVTFLRYPHQGHGFTGEALRDFWRRESAFFDKYLKPERGTR
jgi:dipeptidyl aminopeptidase/acylaminoacyl peptidase